MDDIWFERRSTDGRKGRGVRPVNWKGRAVLGGFVASMVGGGALFALIAAGSGNIIGGAAVFALCAIAGGGTFIWAAATKSRLVDASLWAAGPKPGAPPNPARFIISFTSALVGAAVVAAAIFALTGSMTAAAIAFLILAASGGLMSIWAATGVARRAASGGDRNAGG